MKGLYIFRCSKNDEHEADEKHAVPKYVFWVDNYPKTASGKIQKFKLKEEGINLLREGKGLQ